MVYKGHTIENCRNKKREEVKANITHESEEISGDEMAYPAINLGNKTWRWIFDTGATSHMTRNKQAFINCRPHSGSIRLGNGKKVSVTHIGNIRFNALLPDKSILKIKLLDVLYVPDLKCSLMSWAKIKEKGITMTGKKDITFSKNGKIVGWVVTKNKESIFQEYSKELDRDVANITTDNITIWHRRLGHLPVASMNLLKGAVADPFELPKDINHKIDCEACEKSKMVRKIDKETGNTCSKILEKIHSDVVGPFSVKSVGGKYNYISFTLSLFTTKMKLNPQ